LSSPYVIAGRPQADPDRAMMGRALGCVVTYTKHWFEEIVAKAEPIMTASALMSLVRIRSF